jgi:hypothetical protein
MYNAAGSAVHHNMPKYKQLFQQMVDENQELFTAFRSIHDGYKQDRKKWSLQFHGEGKKIVEIIHDWEHKLCAGMERGNNAVYSSKLSEKFWLQVKELFSHIELVGVKSNLD